jgi:uncharacterized protein (DUF934 family)
MAQLLKDRQIIEDSWLVLDESANNLPSGNIMLSIEQCQQYSEQFSEHHGSIGLWLDGNADIDDIIDLLQQMSVIAIKFPKFVDGRGFSLARLLRERYNFEGELRAIGEFIRDQLYLLQRCGFNAFQFANDEELIEASKSLNDFSETYQVSADQKQPLFRRR